MKLMLNRTFKGACAARSILVLLFFSYSSLSYSASLSTVGMEMSNTVDLEIKFLGYPGEINQKMIFDHQLWPWQLNVAIKNYSDTTVNGSLDVYISKDVSFDVSDSLIHKDDYQFIEGTDTRLFIDIPEGTTSGYETGIYYFICIVDKDGTLNETTVDNNSVIVPVLIFNDPLEDFSVESLSAPIVYAGLNQDIIIEYSLKNAHSTSPMVYVPYKLFLSEDTLLSIEEDAELLSSTAELNKDETHSFEKHWTVPDSIVGKEYYLILQVDPENTLEEFNEENNIMHIKLNIIQEERRHNLSVNNLQVFPTRFFSGEYIEVACIIENLGNVTEYSKVYFYFSQDDSVSTDDHKLYTDSHILKPNEKRNIELDDLKIPATENFGNCYILAHITSSNEDNIPENNISKAATEILEELDTSTLPDYAITDIELEDTVFYKNEWPNIKVCYTNLGGESNNEIRLTGYLSNDNMLDDSDIPLLFNAYIPYLRKGDSTCTNMPGMIPEDITPGNYHLILKIDGTNLTAEHNEENNIISREIFVTNSLVDIYFQAFIDSEFFTTGISKSIDVFCKDVSGEINDSIIINAFISEYSDMNGSETLVFTDTIFYTEYQPLPMLIPEGVTEGQYYLHLHVVYASNKHERNKENNSISMPIGVFKNEMDISIDSFYVAENDIFLNEVFNYGLKISNGSANFIDSVYYSLYLSENKTYEPDEDILIQNGTHFITPFGQTLIESDVKVADTHEPGRYYVLGLASPQQLNNDINELMSVAFDSIWIKPDLSDLKIYSSTTNSDTLVPWNSFQCSLVIHNVGNRATNDYYYTQVYLSKDSIYDNNDLFLDSVASEATQAFSANTSIFNITIPSNNILEQAYLIYHLDKQNIIEEIDDTNNKFSQPVFINKAFIDLSVDSCIIPSDTLAPGASFELSIPVRNLGNVTASLNDVNIYLSSDSVLNKVEDTMLGTYLTQEILPGAEDTTKVDIQIPEGYPLGKTNVLINAEVSELDLGQVILHDTIAGNNTAIKTIIIEAEKHGLHPSWLKEDTLFAVQGQYTDTHFRVFNSGNTDVNNFKIKIYLSKDSLIDSSDDIYFDEAFTNMNIYSGKSYWDYLFFDAPNLEGNYYFILDVVTDFDSANDNLIFKPISFVKAMKEIGIKVYDYPDTLLPQEYFFGKLKVNNYGNTVLSDLNLNFYLSEDSILDSSDTFVNQLPIGYLPVEDSIYSNLYFVVPESNEPIKYLLVEGEPDISLVNENVSKNIAYYELIIDNPGLQTDPEYGNVTIQSFNLSYRLEENNAILTYELWKDTFIVVENLITEFFVSSDTLNPPAQSVFVDSIGVWEGNVLTRIHTFSSDSIQKWNEKYIFLRIPDIKGDTLTTDNSSYLKVDFDITNLNELNSVTDNISIYPSPANIMINIVGRKAINEIKVYSLSGMLVQHHSKLDVEHFQLNLQHLNQGVYFMLIRCDDRWIDKLFIKK